MTYKDKARQSEYYDGRYGNEIGKYIPQKRPALILKFFLKKQCSRKGIGLDQARLEFANRTNLEPNEIVEIENGVPPTSMQIKKITKGMNWSVFFIFGISKYVYDITEAMYFNDLEIKDPTAADKKDFIVLYEYLLSLITD